MGKGATPVTPPSYLPSNQLHGRFPLGAPTATDTVSQSLNEPLVKWAAEAGDAHDELHEPKPTFGMPKLTNCLGLPWMIWSNQHVNILCGTMLRHKLSLSNESKHFDGLKPKNSQLDTASADQSSS